MARVAGADIPDAKRVEIALTYIYGIGRTRSVKILTDTKVDKNIRVKDLSDDQLVSIRDYIEGNYKVEGDLFVVSAPRPTLALARVQSAPWPARRRLLASN